jgi:RNA methyltransferase, TrmH family
VSSNAQPGPARVRALSSARNSLLKLFRRALSEGVTREGWLACEGPLLLEDALESGSAITGAGRCQVRTVIVSDTAAEKFASLISRLPQEAETARIPDALFGELAQTETPQGVAALVELAPPSLEFVLQRADACLLVACGVQDPGNMGTMIRSAQALGGTAVVALKDTVNPFNPKAVRSSAGAIFRIPVFRNFESKELFARLRAAGVTIIAGDRHSPVSLAQAHLRDRVAFLIGREGSGMDHNLLRQASLRLRIPIRADTDSVNAGVAAGIFLYEAARQRGFRY